MFALWLLPLLPATLAQANIASVLASLGPAPISDPRFTSWTAPGANDVRSPCPGLNTLANHGFLNHSGRNLTIPQLLTGMAAGMNIGPDFSTVIGALGLLAAPDPFAGSFDLNWLDQHNFPIEHDGSLSRRDAYFGNDYSFHAPTWKQTLSFYGPYGGQTALLPAAQGIANRTAASEANNPTFTYGFREFILRYGETALFLQAMGGDDSTGVTRLDFVRSLFEKERLPVALGWKPRTEPITLLTLGQMVNELFSASPSQVPEGQKVLADSYKDVLELAVGGSEILNNLTAGYAHAVGL